VLLPNTNEHFFININNINFIYRITIQHHVKYDFNIHLSLRLWYISTLCSSTLFPLLVLKYKSTLAEASTTCKTIITSIIIHNKGEISEKCIERINNRARDQPHPLLKGPPVVHKLPKCWIFILYSSQHLGLLIERQVHALVLCASLTLRLALVYNKQNPIGINHKPKLLKATCTLIHSKIEQTKLKESQTII
jgi:hypothetical protein